jgi:hypothetical protein
VSERTVGYLVRGLVAIVLASAVVATWATRVTFTMKSGTFYGLMVYIPVLAAPGWLVWRSPLQPRLMAVWSAVGWISTILWFMFGLPYSWERRPSGWVTIETALTVAIASVLFVVPIAGFLVAAHNRPRTTVERDQALIAQRLRRIAQLSLVLGIVAVGLSLTPPDGAPRDMRIAPEVAIMLAIVLAPAALVLRAPQRKWAWLWTAWTAPTALLSSLYGTDAYDRVPTTWQLSFAACGTIYVLLLAVMPLFCLMTRDAAEAVPSARAR